MKKLILLMIILISFSINAQMYKPVGEKTGKIVKIDTKEYPVMVNKNGSEYFLCKSPRTGNNYAVWIGTLTDKVYRGKPVRISKRGKYFVIIMSTKTNNPYCKYLKEEEIE